MIKGFRAILMLRVRVERFKVYGFRASEAQTLNPKPLNPLVSKAQDQAALSKGIQLIPGHDAPGFEQLRGGTKVVEFRVQGFRAGGSGLARWLSRVGQGFCGGVYISANVGELKPLFRAPNPK